VLGKGNLVYGAPHEEVSRALVDSHRGGLESQRPVGGVLARRNGGRVNVFATANSTTASGAVDRTRPPGLWPRLTQFFPISGRRKAESRLR